jgi:hypothetical protein
MEIGDPKGAKAPRAAAENSATVVRDEPAAKPSIEKQQSQALTRARQRIQRYADGEGWSRSFLKTGTLSQEGYVLSHAAPLSSTAYGLPDGHSFGNSVRKLHNGPVSSGRDSIDNQRRGPVAGRERPSNRLRTHSRHRRDSGAVDLCAKPLRELERVEGIEPSTRSLGSCCSTTELHPRPATHSTVRCRQKGAACHIVARHFVKSERTSLQGVPAILIIVGA